MENIVNLEQLDYRDQLIKEYIDEHSSSFTASNGIQIVDGDIQAKVDANNNKG